MALNQTSEAIDPAVTVEATVTAEKPRTVALYTWFTTPEDKVPVRSFAVVEKTCQGVGMTYRTTHVALLEYMNETPIRRTVEDFWDLVDKGSLIEAPSAWAGPNR